MRQGVRLIVTGSLFAMMFAGAPALAQQAKKAETGKDLALDQSKGNCLACHRMPGLVDVETPGNIGLPLIAMSARFPDKRVLRDKLFDATAPNPASVMPPYGKHEVLTYEEINKVVDFVYGL